MAKLLNRLFGLLHPTADSVRDQPAPAQPPRLIRGAGAAPELCMLAVDGPSAADWGDLHRGIVHQPPKRIVQLKADGIRALYIDGRVVSREGAPLDCALHCQPGLARIEAGAGMPLMIDGEYVADEGYNATMTEHKRREGSGVFWAFDAMPLADWEAGRCDAPLALRLARLRTMIEASDSLFVGMLDSWMLDLQQTHAKAHEIWAAGGEGVVSKHADSPYVRERSRDWLRIKQTITHDGPVVDMIGRPDGTLAAMIVRGPSGPVKVATGWTVAEGRTLLAMHAGALTDSPIWAEISFQLSTGSKRSVRGARFHRIRVPKES